jgi:hypothetical protein
VALLRAPEYIKEVPKVAGVLEMLIFTEVYNSFHTTDFPDYIEKDTE